VRAEALRWNRIILRYFNASGSASELCAPSSNQDCAMTSSASAARRALAKMSGDLPDLDRLEEAGLIGRAPLPDELRSAFGIREDDEDEDEDSTASAADDDGNEDDAGLRWAEE
jgi:hypothetical protein